MLRKILSLVLSFGLIFQQTSFAQMAVDLNIASRISGVASNMTQERFRPAHLRYFAYDNLNDNFKVLLDKGDLKDSTARQRESSTKTLLTYFLTGVALPDDAFWVNLRPDGADQIIDQYLGKTDVGRIMLEADLQLKKDTALFTSPRTPEGKAYWDKLYKRAAQLYGYDNVNIPTMTRPWIVPGEIIVREAQGSAYVYKANLRVMLEQDFLKDSPAYSFNDDRAKALNEYSSQLIRESIIPKLTKEVNSSKRYAGLRQVYYSLVLSRWFKLRFAGETGIYAKLINSKDLTNLVSKESWSKDAYFKQYQRSFAQGEYNIQEPVSTPTGQVIHSYFSGGIDVTQGSINTQNGIVLTKDNAAKLGKLDGGKADLDPGKIVLAPVSVVGFSLGNIRKAEILRTCSDFWANCVKSLSILYPGPYAASDPKDMYATVLKATEKYRDNGTGTFIVQFLPYAPNMGDPRWQDSMKPRDELKQDRQLFASWKFFSSGEYADQKWSDFIFPQKVGGVSVTSFNAPKPYAAGHLVLTPELENNLPQALTANSVKVALSILSESDYAEHLKIGFNGQQAFASISQLHIQSVFFEDVDDRPAEMPIEKAVIVPFKDENGQIILVDGVSISETVDYPAKTFVFQGRDIGKLTKTVFSAVKVMQDNSLAYPEELVGKGPQYDPKVGIPHNALFTKTADGQFRVFLFPRKNQSKDEDALPAQQKAEAKGIGAAFLELAGVLQLGKKEILDSILKDGIDAVTVKELRRIQLAPADSQALRVKLAQALRDLNDGGASAKPGFVTLMVNKDLQGLNFKDVEKAINSGKTAIAEVSVDWAKKIKETFPKDVYTIFISPLSEEQIKARMDVSDHTWDEVIFAEMMVRQRARAAEKPTDPGKQFARAEAAPKEMARQNEYDKVIVNNALKDLEKDAARWAGPEGDKVVGEFMNAVEAARNSGKKLILYSGPSATGKTPLWNQAQSRFKDQFSRIVLYTTRQARPGEEEGVDYYFRTVDQLEALKKELNAPAFDEEQLRRQLNTVLHNLRWAYKNGPLLLSEKKAIELVEERHFLAGPGTDDLHYMDDPWYRELNDDYNAALAKMKLATEAKITEVINWVKDDPENNLKREDVRILEGVGPQEKVIGVIDRGIAKKLGLTYVLAGPVKPGSNDGGLKEAAPAAFGGIDLRALPMSIQPMGSFSGLNYTLPKLSQASLDGIDLESEIRQIRNLVKSGTIPSGERIKELIAACAQKGEIKAYADTVLLCVADILKLEEDNVIESSPELREALVMVDVMG